MKYKWKVGDIFYYKDDNFEEIGYIYRIKTGSKPTLFYFYYISSIKGLSNHTHFDYNSLVYNNAVKLTKDEAMVKAL